MQARTPNQAQLCRSSAIKRRSQTSADKYLQALAHVGFILRIQPVDETSVGE